MFDLKDPAGIMLEVNACRNAFPEHYIRVNGYDRSYGRQTTALSFIVNRPAHEPGFRLERAGSGRPPDPLHASIRDATETLSASDTERSVMTDDRTSSPIAAGLPSTSTRPHRDSNIAGAAR